MTKRLTAIPFCWLIVLSSLAAAQAQAPSPLSAKLKDRIENEIRSRYSVPTEVDVSIGELKPSSVPGYDDFVVTFLHADKKTSFDFLVSKDRKTLAHLEKIDVSQDPMANITTSGRPFRGNVNAPVTVVSFVDFQCPYCAHMHATWFPTIMQQYQNRVKFVYVDYPLTEIHSWAMRAALDANCLAEQSTPAYWNFVDYLYANQNTFGKDLAQASQHLDKAAGDEASREQLNAAALQECMQKADATAIKASMAEGDKLGVDSTPTTVINGLRISGTLTEDKLRKLLDRALQTASTERASAQP